MDENYIGIEIGGTKQQILVCESDGSIKKRISEEVPHVNGAIDILVWLEKNVLQVLNEFPEIRKIGIGFGGAVETSTGRVLGSVHVPGWKDFELKTWAEKVFNRRTFVVNDTVAGGYAEYKLGSGRGSKAFFYSNIGTGIGGSLFIDGKPYDGIGFGASYIGNTYVADWTADIPGAIDRMEVMCSGSNIEKRLRSEGYVPKDSMLYELCEGDRQKIDCRMLKKAIDAKDSFSLEEFKKIGATYGVGIGNVVSMLGVDTVSIGGGLANFGEPLRSITEEYAEKVVFISGKNRFKVVICELIRDNVPIGAALFARDGLHTV